MFDPHHRWSSSTSFTRRGAPQAPVQLRGVKAGPSGSGPARRSLLPFRPRLHAQLPACGVHVVQALAAGQVEVAGRTRPAVVRRRCARRRRSRRRARRSRSRTAILRMAAGDDEIVAGLRSDVHTHRLQVEVQELGSPSDVLDRAASTAFSKRRGGPTTTFAATRERDDAVPSSSGRSPRAIVRPRELSILARGRQADVAAIEQPGTRPSSRRTPLRARVPGRGRSRHGQDATSRVTRRPSRRAVPA